MPELGINRSAASEKNIELILNDSVIETHNYYSIKQYDRKFLNNYLLYCIIGDYKYCVGLVELGEGCEYITVFEDEKTENISFISRKNAFNLYDLKGSNYLDKFLEENNKEGLINFDERLEKVILLQDKISDCDLLIARYRGIQYKNERYMLIYDGANAPKEICLGLNPRNEQRVFDYIKSIGIKNIDVNSILPFGLQVKQPTIIAPELSFN